jgi:hypothetical protein
MADPQAKRASRRTVFEADMARIWARFALLYAAKSPISRSSSYPSPLVSLSSGEKRLKRMSRRRRVCLVVGLLGLGVLALTSSQTISPVARAAKTANLKDQLEKGLKARRPEEFAFIAKVVSRVENDTLPRSLVDSTFLWARKKGTGRIRPYQYFESGLKLRAKRIGVSL